MLAARDHRRSSASLTIAALVLALATPAAGQPKRAQTTSQPAAETSTPAASWWHRGYALDYGLIAAGGVLYLLPSLMDTPGVARIGPVFDPEAPARVLDDRLAGDIGEPYAEEGDGETVPTLWMGYALGAGLVALTAQELSPWLRGTQPDARRLHDTVIGYIEGLALTLGVMEVLKVGVGRLRPDFQARALRFHCHTEVIAGLDCAGTAPLDPDPDRARWLLNDGRKSFPSGHAATSMYLSSYLSFAIGGRYVWASDATATSRGVGVLAQAALLSGGIFTARSRYVDGRHHLSDVMAGAAIGLGFATLSYWRRFNTDGALRRRQGETASAPVTWQLSPAATGRGLTVQGRF